MAKTTKKVAAAKAAPKKTAQKAAAKKTTKKVAVKKAAATTSQSTAPKNEGSIAIRIETAGNVYEGKVADVGAFIQSLGLTHTNTKTIVRAEFEGRSVDYVLFTAKAHRLFTNNMAALIFDRNVKRALAYADAQ